MSKYDLLWTHLERGGASSATLTFDEIAQIAGVAVDHSFLRYKEELLEHGYRVKKIFLKEQKISFEKLKETLVVYVHGKGGTAAEAKHYEKLFADCDVVGLGYKCKTLWEAQIEFSVAFQKLANGYKSVALVANSIGAYFSMLALPQEKIQQAYFISPIVDMEKLIFKMMRWANVSESDLKNRGTIATEFGETLSWEYLNFVRENPIRWKVPTAILYGLKDHLTDKETVAAFANEHGATLTVMNVGEHWFHTKEQMAFLDEWISQNQRRQ